MKRLRGSLTAYPIEHYPSSIEENTLYDMLQLETNGIYSKLVLADRSQVISIIERESNELRAQLLEDENCPEKCFIEQAITLLKDREDFVLKSLIENVHVEEAEEVVVDDLDVSQSSSSQLVKHHYFYQGNKIFLFL